MRPAASVSHLCRAGWLFVLLSAAACASLPPNVGRTESHALTNTLDTQIAQRIAFSLARHPRSNAFRALEDDAAALNARLALIDGAQRSLDVQYYIWRDDASGRLLAGALLRAADRGVRVRVLLDDLGTQADDDALRAIDSHPGIELRLFNPVPLRTLRGLGVLQDFSRVNRRMHNKAFVADNQVAILGGRNIGDEYFGVNEELVFDDLDVLTYGPVVPRISRTFDNFWNAKATYPVATLTGGRPDPTLLENLRQVLAESGVRAEPPAPAGDPLDSALGIGSSRLYWGRAWLMHDLPEKIEREPASDEGLLASSFFRRGDRVKRELTVVSPYFVPGKAGLAWFRDLAARGVKITILTNSLAASDVAAVHTGYARYREALLEAGIRLYELKPLAEPGARPSRRPVPGSSRASLHAKAFMFDRSTVYIGSLNIDPRSVHLNTEIGLMCESPLLTESLLRVFEGSLDTIAWRLAFEPNASGRKHLVWIERAADGSERRLTDEPGSSWARRFGAWLLGLLPIESQL